MNKTNECAPVAYVKHAAGCPVFTANEFTREVKKSPWILALISMALGLYIAFKGRMQFEAASTFFAVFIFAKIFIFAAAYHEFIEDTTSEVIVLIAGLLFGLVAGQIVKKQDWLGPALFGISSGLAVGAIFYAIALVTFGNSTVTSLE